MAGLPRSGSTLISTILNQNPRIYSGPTSPVVSTMVALETSLHQDELFLAYPKNDFGQHLVSSVIDFYYSDIYKPIVIEKNRSWINRLEYINGYFKIKNPKIIYPVRDISEILTSFLTMIHRNPSIVNERLNFIDQILVQNSLSINDENRCKIILNHGILGHSLNGLKKSLNEGYKDNIYFVEYKDLVSNPQLTIKNIYEFLEEPYFNHQFINLKNLHQENDEFIYGLTDMHHVRETIELTSLNPNEVLPKNILESVKGAEFWRKPKSKVLAKQL